MILRPNSDQRFVKQTKSLRPKAGFLQRRRARQREDMSGRTYTFELAALHLQLLVAMAAVDDQLRSIEVEEVGAFVDRASLPPADRARLELLVRTSIDAPPQLELLLEGLSSLARRPALAQLLVSDLARVAASDDHAHPRESDLLDLVCETLQLEPVTIKVEPSVPLTAAPERPTGPRPARLVDQHRVRSAVRRSLETSYLAGNSPFLE